MTKKLPLLLTAIALIGMLSACGQAQPNEGTLDINEGTADAVDKPDRQKLQDMYDIIETDFFGEGTVTYQVNSLELKNSWEEAGISEDELCNDYHLKAGDKVLLISIAVNNIDVPLDNDYAQENLISICLESSSAQNEKDYYFSEPSYFDKAFRDEDGNLSEKRYYQYTLPAPGESVDVVLGWVIFSEDIDRLEANELYLSEGLSNSIVPISINN